VYSQNEKGGEDAKASRGNKFLALGGAIRKESGQVFSLGQEGEKWRVQGKRQLNSWGEKEGVDGWKREGGAETSRILLWSNGSSLRELGGRRKRAEISLVIAQLLCIK